MALLAVGLVLLARAPLPNTYLLDLLPASLLVALGLPAAFAGTNIAASRLTLQTLLNFIKNVRLVCDLFVPIDKMSH